MRPCEAIREELSAYLDGELPPEDAAALARHLEGCPACREELETLRRVAALVRELPRQAAPPAFPDRVGAALEGRRARPGRGLAWAQLAAAAAVLAAGLWWTLHPPVAPEQLARPGAEVARAGGAGPPGEEAPARSPEVPVARPAAPRTPPAARADAIRATEAAEAARGEGAEGRPPGAAEEEPPDRPDVGTYRRRLGPTEEGALEEAKRFLAEPVREEAGKEAETEGLRRTGKPTGGQTGAAEEVPAPAAEGEAPTPALRDAAVRQRAEKAPEPPHEKRKAPAERAERLREDKAALEMEKKAEFLRKQAEKHRRETAPGRAGVADRPRALRRAGRAGPRPEAVLVARGGAEAAIRLIRDLPRGIPAAFPHGAAIYTLDLSRGDLQRLRAGLQQGGWLVAFTEIPSPAVGAEGAAALARRPAEAHDAAAAPRARTRAASRGAGVRPSRGRGEAKGAGAREGRAGAAGARGSGIGAAGARGYQARGAAAAAGTVRVRLLILPGAEGP